LSITKEKIIIKIELITKSSVNYEWIKIVCTKFSGKKQTSSNVTSINDNTEH